MSRQAGKDDAARLVAEVRAALAEWRRAGVEWVAPEGRGRPAPARPETHVPEPPTPGPVAGPRAAAAPPTPPPPPAAPARDLFGMPVAADRPRGRGGAGLLAAGPAEPPAASLAEVRERLGDCRRCKLWEGRTNIVFGVGNERARLMFVGEGPGRDEDLQGEPFVGRAGQLLTKIIEAIGLRREQVYIANVVRCRPPDNRRPEPDEIAACQPFLRQTMAVVRPRVVVALGSVAAQTLLGTTRGITALRGKFHQAGDYRVMPTFHPAYLLRNPAAKREVWEDMKLVRDALAALPEEG
ncbi:MAG TPA: uracil-DNA glycosylase [Thermodesulfobacteriota bacterium]